MLIYMIELAPLTLGDRPTWEQTTDKDMVQHFVDEARQQGRAFKVFSVEATHYQDWPE